MVFQLFGSGQLTNSHCFVGLQIKQGIFASYYQIFLQVQAPLVPAQLDQFQDLSRDLTPPLAPV